ncbi:MAG: lipid-A-disaccharide synthase [Bacteroidetes bacterium]|nr:lipid-A-disaccharide synthase [Bacteroidota bacterium]MDA1121747.1 lipid-A-disaccharide synthase [Bacteroidota bacterium]
MKYYIIAGEASGDVHGARLAEILQSADHSAVIHGVGGHLMIEAGVTLLFQYHVIAIMGFWHVLKRVIVLRGYLQRCKNDITSFQPDVVILIDSAGFNLRIAKYVKRQDPGIKILYFIPPKVWAWGGWRIKQLQKYVDQVVVLFPFEQEFFTAKGLTTHYYGYPENDDKQSKTDVIPNWIALLPGSRIQEIESTLPTMLEVAKRFSGYQFVICAMDVISEKHYRRNKLPENVEIRWNNVHEVLDGSIAAIVTSGTATLQACYARVPQVVVYKTNWMNYFIARILVQVEHISLVNLIAGQEVVKELIQTNFNTDRLSDQLTRLIEDPDYRNKILNWYGEIRGKLKCDRVYEKSCDRILQKNLSNL